MTLMDVIVSISLIISLKITLLGFPFKSARFLVMVMNMISLCNRYDALRCPTPAPPSRLRPLRPLTGCPCVPHIPRVPAARAVHAYRSARLRGLCRRVPVPDGPDQPQRGQRRRRTVLVASDSATLLVGDGQHSGGSSMFFPLPRSGD